MFVLMAIMLFISCGNKGTNDSENQDSGISSSQLSVDKARRAAICDSLRKVEGDTILGDVRLGMAEKDYVKAIAKLQKELGNNLKMDSITYFFDDPNTTQWVNGKLCSYSLKGNFPDYLVTLDGKELLEDQETTPTFRRALQHFITKYGNADEYADHEGKVVNNLDYCRKATWNLGYKTIEIYLKDGDYYTDFTGTNKRLRTLIVKYSKPLLMKEYYNYNDSIEEAIRKKEEKEREKDKKFGNQL